MESSDGIAATCHSVPCNICYTGPAPGVDVYFRPLDLSTAPHSEETPAISYQAAALRGRGLLAQLDDRNRVCGRVLKVQSSFLSDASKEERGLQSIRSFNRYVEWHHEHQKSVLQNARQGSKLHRARDWMVTAEALHAPLPLDPSDNGSGETC